MCHISPSTSETASPVILTPASSQSSPNGYSAIMEFGKKPHKPVEPAFFPTMNQDFRNRPGFNALDANYRTPEECLSYIQTLTQLAYNGSLSMGKEVTLEYIQALGLAAYQDLEKGEESPFMTELKQMAAEFNATNNTANPLHSVPQRYLSSQEPDDDESESYSNAATAGESEASEERLARVGTREMDFRCEQQRERYINGLGLPHDGGSLEDRLLRAINMNHYILVGHMNKEQKELGDYVSETVTKALDHSHHRLWKKMHTIQQKIDMLSRNSVKESSPLRSSFMPPSSERTTPRPPASDIGEGNSLAHLELAILKLWAHIDKIRAEDRLRAEEKAERRELEELIANEILNHHHTMEKMQAKISSMTKEVACCWMEIRNLQDAVKGLGGRVRVNTTGVIGTGEAEVHSTSATPDSAKLLEKINKELENLIRKPGANTENVREDEHDECGCDLCGKARAGKSAGVTVGGKSNEQAAASQVGNEPSGYTRKFDERETTLPAGPIPETSKLAELGQRIVNGVILSDFTAGSPTLQRCIQKWKEHFSIDMMGNQNILELRRPNGDVLVLVTEPSGERKNTAIWEIPRVKQPGFPKVTATDTKRNAPLGWFSSHPTSGTQPFAPLPEVARNGIPVTRLHQQPKFGSYGFPWMDCAQGKQPVQDKDVSTQSNNSQGKRQILQQKLSELKNMINESSSSHGSGLESSKSKKHGWQPVSVESEESTPQTLSPPKSNGGDKHEAVKEEEMSMDTMLAAIDAALTKMSALAKRNEIENERKNAGTLTGGSEPTATAATTEQCKE